MSMRMKKETMVFMDVLSGLSKVMRSCCRDEAFCGGVTFHQFMILDAVAREKELHMADLHRMLSVEKSTTTRLVNPLITKGLLKRETAVHDSRAARLVLSSKGEETRNTVLECLADFFHKALGGMPAKKREEVLESVKIFIAAINNSADGCGCC